MPHLEGRKNLGLPSFVVSFRVSSLQERKRCGSLHRFLPGLGTNLDRVQSDEEKCRKSAGKNSNRLKARERIRID